MKYQDITILDIKKKYFREKSFLFSPYKEHDETKEYSLDEIIIYFNADKPAREIYKSLKDNNQDPINNTLSWAKQTNRKINLYITDSDIQETLDRATIYTTENILLTDQANIDSVYLLVGHYLEYTNLINNQDAQIEPISSKSTSAGSASVSFDNNLISSGWFLNAAFLKTVYGSEYLSLYKKYRSLIKVIL
jgi:hypothetical protein